MPLSRVPLLLLLVSAVALGPLPWSAGPGPLGAAWADDEDDDDDDDDDDDGDDRGGGSSGGAASTGGSPGGGDGDGSHRATPTGTGDDPLSRFLRRVLTPEAETGRGTAGPAPPRAPQTAPRPVARIDLPDAAPDEILAFDLSVQDLASLTAQGFAELASDPLPGLGVTLHRLQIAPGLTLSQARDTVRALPSGQGADFNTFYRSEAGPAPCAGPHCADRATVDWPAGAACGPLPAIGMIDTGVNADHESLAGADLTVHRFADTAFAPSQAVHGTAVAALLVGTPDSRSPGLVPDARLIAVDAFHRAGRDERADAAALLRALSFLAEEGVGVINLSLAGPPNALVERAAADLTEARGIVLAAAAGNGGPRAEDAHPAALDSVIAVTAVDRDARPYRRAQRGDHVELAAPGVDVWTAASISGARPKTGTSFAVPFVTAALARLRAQEAESAVDALRARLAEGARDLGAPGRDPVTGYGLMSAAGLCAQARPLPGDG